MLFLLGGWGPPVRLALSMASKAGGPTHTKQQAVEKGESWGSRVGGRLHGCSGVSSCWCLWAAMSQVQA